MCDTSAAPEDPLVPIEPHDAAELIATALSLTKGRVRQADIAREANSAVADRLLEYFRQSGVVLMRPPPREAHSSTGMGMSGPSSPRER